MLENKYKQGLKKRIIKLFPGCMILPLDPNDTQGIPDMLLLYKKTWAALEVKRSAKATHRPNQDYYVKLMNDMCKAFFICPENEVEVLNELQEAFGTKR